MKTVAVLNENNVLIGSKKVKDDAPGIDCGDLPTNGKYKYDEPSKQFIPLGHGFGKVKVAQPVTDQLVMFHLIAAVEKSGVTLPDEVEKWRDWYEQDLRRRDEEFAARPR